MIQLSPQQKEWGIVILLVVILGIALYGLGGALLPLLLAFILAYLVFPVIKRLEQRGLDRRYAVFGVFTLLFLSLALVLLIVIPSVIRDARQFAQDFPPMVASALEKLEGALGQAGFAVDLSQEQLQQFVAGHISELSATLFKSLTQGAKQAFAGLAGWLVAILNFFLFPVFFFYLVHDFEKISRQITLLLPRDWQGPLAHYAQLSNRVLSGYVRGQFTVALILGVLYALGLWLVGLKFGLLVGFVSGLMSIIPYAGFTIGFVTAITIGLANYSGMELLLGIVVVFTVVQALEGTIITPRFVGDKVGLSALATLLALIIGGNLLGFVGMLVAVPVAAILRSALAELITRYQATALYGQEAGPAGPSSDPG